MNGYQLMAESYRKAYEENKVFKEEAERKIKVFEFLANCDEEDICNLFDSTAFNDIAVSYLRLAVSELINENVIDEEQGRKIRNRYRLLFDEKRAYEVI